MRDVLRRRLAGEAAVEEEVARDAKGGAKLLDGEALDGLQIAARLRELPRRVGHLLVLGQREDGGGHVGGDVRHLAGGDAAAREGARVVGVLGVGAARLQRVDDLAELALHGELVDLAPVVLGVLARLDAAALAVEEEILRVERAAAVLFALLRVDARARERDLGRERELGERGGEGAEVEDLAHRRDDVAGGIRVLADEDARLVVDFGRVRRVLGVHKILPLVPNAAALDVGHVVRLARRHQRVQVDGHVALDGLALALVALRGAAALDDLLGERVVVLLVDADGVAPLEQAVDDVGRVRDPQLLEMRLELGGELDVLAVAPQRQAAIEELAMENGARRRDRGVRGVELLDRRDLRRVQAVLARAARLREAHRGADEVARLAALDGALAARTQADAVGHFGGLPATLLGGAARSASDVSARRRDLFAL